MLPRGDVFAACRGYEDKIVAAGGLDLQVLGIGRTGRIGFNEPGSTRDSRTRLVTLDGLTRRDAAPVDTLPASFLQGHPNVSFYIDGSAASVLTRMRHP